MRREALALDWVEGSTESGGGAEKLMAGLDCGGDIVAEELRVGASAASHTWFRVIFASSPPSGLLNQPPRPRATLLLYNTCREDKCRAAL